MPTPRKPTNVLKLSGSISKHPERIKAREHEPVPDPEFGNVPRHLTDNQKLIWREIVSEIPPCVASKADRKVVEVAVRMTERMRNDTAHSADYATLLRCLSQLGMTPADRSKVKVTPQEPKTAADPFADFLGESEPDGSTATQ